MSLQQEIENVALRLSAELVDLARRDPILLLSRVRKAEMELTGYIKLSNIARARKSSTPKEHYDLGVYEAAFENKEADGGKV